MLPQPGRNSAILQSGDRRVESLPHRQGSISHLDRDRARVDFSSAEAYISADLSRKTQDLSVSTSSSAGHRSGSSKGGDMRRVLVTLIFAGALAAGSLAVHAQGDGGYKLVPNWPKMPAGMYFGLKTPPPGPAERDAQAAAQRARGGQRGGGGAETPQPG